MKKNINCASGWWVVLLTATLALPALGDSVGLYNATLSQVITSSTLKWSNFKRENIGNYVVGASSAEGPIYLCRTRHDGDMLLGQLRPNYKSCAVSGSKSFDVFEILENLENASLIVWKPWAKFHSKPNGAVVVAAGDSVFIGRKKSSGGFSHNIGRISYESAIGHLYTFDEKNNELVENSGEILVELEPIHYKLQNVDFDWATQHVRKADPFIIEERVLRNDADEAVTVKTEVGYAFNYSLSWGHGHGLAIGLSVAIEFANGTKFPPIGWSTLYTEEKQDVFALEQYLEPGTACNVTLRGRRIDRDAQYTGKLTTYYNDEEYRVRQLRGESIENTLEVEAEYGEVYFLGNNSLVPTTTTTTTTSTTTTTTTPAPTLPPVAPEINEIPIQEKPASIEMQSDSSEGVKSPSAKEDNLNRAVYGGLGSNPNAANKVIASLSLLIPMFTFLL